MSGRSVLVPAMCSNRRCLAKPRGVVPTLKISWRGVYCPDNKQARAGAQLAEQE